MKTQKLQLLPVQFLNSFYKTLSIKEILLNLYRIGKQCIQQKSSSISNLSAFLTIDKCRKVAQMKEDAFIKEVIKNLEDYHNLLMNKSDTNVDLPKINLTELSKFAQLFYQRKSQFSYLQTIVQNISSSLSQNQKDQQKNAIILEKMNFFFKEIEQKLIIVIEKCKQNGRTSNLIKQNLKCSYQNLKKTQKQYTNFNERAERPHSQNKTKSQAKKVINLTTDKCNIQNVIQKIFALKSQYRRLNSKTQWNKTILNGIRKVGDKKATINFFTESDQQVDTINTDQNNKNLSSEQEKFSIRLKRQTSTKHSSSFSILNKSSKHSSFIVANNLSKHNSIQRPSNLPQQIRRYLEVKGQKKQRSILKKKSTAYNFLNRDNLVVKKAINSVHRSSNFGNNENKKGKSHEKRISTAKMRQITQIQNELKQKTYLKRASRTQPNIIQQKDNEQLTLDLLCVDQINEESQLKSKQTAKLISHVQIRQEQNKQKNDDQTVVMKKFGNFKNKKDKNRRKGFSKKHIDVDEDSDHYKQKPIPTRRRSSIWKEAQQNQQVQPNQVSIEKNGQQQIMSKSRTNIKVLDQFRNRNKLIFKKNRKLCEQIGNEQIQTQKTIKTNMLGKTKKYIKGQQNAVDSSDCVQLYKQITQQWKKDKQQLYSWCLQNMMRKKYDSGFKPLQDNFQFDLNNQLKLSNGIKMKVFQSEITEGKNRKSTWGNQCDNFEQIDFSKIISKKSNQLGQKSMQHKKTISTLVEDIQTIYI